MRDANTVFDALETRCPRLGGTVPFDYCRRAGSGFPCSRSLVCWEPQFPVERYMRAVLDVGEWHAVFETPAIGRLDRVLTALYSARQEAEIPG